MFQGRKSPSDTLFSWCEAYVPKIRGKLIGNLIMRFMTMLVFMIDIWQFLNLGLSHVAMD